MSTDGLAMQAEDQWELGVEADAALDRLAGVYGPHNRDVERLPVWTDDAFDELLEWTVDPDDAEPSDDDEPDDYDDAWYARKER